jgi:fluoride exporter
MGSEARAGQRAVVRGARRQRDPRVIAAVALGGALGAPARYGISLAVHVTPGTFPWGTFWTNVSGSFALGFFLALVLERFPPTRYLRPFVATGFLGAYTSYSTFAVETDLLVRNGHLSVAFVYVLASFGAGLTAAWVGALLTRAAPRLRRPPL